MVGAAILSAKEVIGADLSRLEPNRRVATGQDVLLDTEDRNEEVVNDVLGSHGELDRHSNRHMKLVNFARPLGMLQVPHPLLADHENFHGRIWRTRIFKIQARSPDK